jgi:hypothetical protein
MKALIYGTDSPFKYTQMMGEKGMVESMSGFIIFSALHKFVDLRPLRKQIEYSNWQIRKIQERKRWGSHKYTYFER